jgi:hypothetical protein
MSERYWITGVQLGCLVALEHSCSRANLAKEIERNQFIGTKEDLQKILKPKKEVLK